MRVKKKAPSLPALCNPVREVTVLPTDQKAHHVCSTPLVSLPSTGFFFVVNVMLPDYTPTMFGSDADGPGWSIIVVWEVPESMLSEIRQPPADPVDGVADEAAGWRPLASRLFDDTGCCDRGDQGRSDDNSRDINSRFKAMFEVGMPSQRGVYVVVMIYCCLLLLL
jgi:hypothetical protein